MDPTSGSSQTSILNAEAADGFGVGGGRDSFKMSLYLGGLELDTTGPLP